MVPSQRHSSALALRSSLPRFLSPASTPDAPAPAVLCAHQHRHACDRSDCVCHGGCPRRLCLQGRPRQRPAQGPQRLLWCALFSPSPGHTYLLLRRAAASITPSALLVLRTRNRLEGRQRIPRPLRRHPASILCPWPCSVSALPSAEPHAVFLYCCRQSAADCKRRIALRLHAERLRRPLRPRQEVRLAGPADSHLPVQPGRCKALACIGAEVSGSQMKERGEWKSEKTFVFSSYPLRVSRRRRPVCARCASAHQRPLHSACTASLLTQARAHTHTHTHAHPPFSFRNLDSACHSHSTDSPSH